MEWLLLIAFVLGPGWLFAAVVLPRAASYERIACALAIGMAASGWLLLSVAYLAGLRANGALVAAVAVPLLGVALFTRLRFGVPTSFEDTRGDSIVTVLCFAVAAAYLLNYDGFLFRHGSCLSDDVTWCAGPWSQWSFAPLDIRGLTGGQRLGSIAWPLPFEVLLGAPGFRLLFALDALLIACALAGLGRVLVGGAGGAALTVVVGMLTPYLFQVAVVDENTITLALGAATLMLATTDRVVRARAWTVGALAGVLVAVRHLLLVALAGLGHALITRLGRRAAIRFGIALAVVLVPAIYHHATFFAAGAWESRYSGVQNVAGVRLPAYQFLNWPWHEEVVRTPFNPYPTALMFPLRFVREWGFLLAGAVALGAVAMARRRRRDLLTLVLFGLPVLLTLAPLEQWTKPNKMGLWLVVLMVPAVLAAAGLRALRPTRRSVLEAACALSVVFAAWALATTVSAPPDPRTAARSQATKRMFHTERASLLSAARTDLLGAALWPAWDGYGRFSEPFAAWKVAFEAPPVFPTRLDSPPAPDGTAVRLRLTAERIREPWIEVHAAAGLVLAPGGAAQVRNLRAPWTPDALQVLVLRRDPILFVVTIFDNLEGAAEWQPADELQIVSFGRRAELSGDVRSLPAAPVLSVDVSQMTHVVAIDVWSNADELFQVFEAALVPLAEAPPRMLYLP